MKSGKPLKQQESNMPNKTFCNGVMISFLTAFLFPDMISANDCGDVIKPLSYFDKISRYSLFICFGLFAIGILIDRKPEKVIALSLSGLTLAGGVADAQNLTDILRYHANIHAIQTNENIQSNLP